MRPRANQPPCSDAKVIILIKFICLHIIGGKPANDNSTTGTELVVYYQICMHTNVLAHTYIHTLQRGFTSVLKMN